MTAADRPFFAARFGVLTVSDTRTLETDRSGALIVERLEQMGHQVVRREIHQDDAEGLREILRGWIEDPQVEIIIATGGTGLADRDVTPEALAPLVTKPIPGFGELFRALSCEEIGSSTVQSRAEAARCQDTYVFLLPGSTGAVRLAFDRILGEQLDARHRPCNFIELLPRAPAKRGQTGAP